MDALSPYDRFALPTTSAFLPRTGEDRPAPAAPLEPAPRITTRVREEVRFLGDVVEITEIEERQIEEGDRTEPLPSRVSVRLIPEEEVPGAQDPGGLLDLFA